jgi:glycerol uptake facilitator-like aquaporin
MAKSKAKNAKRNKNAKQNTVEAEKAKIAKKGEEIIDDEEIEEVVEDEEVVEEDEDIEETDADEEDDDSEEDEDESDEEDYEDESDEDEDDSDEDDDDEDEVDESEDEDSEDDEDDEDSEEDDEDDEEDEDEEDDEDDEDEDSDDEDESDEDDDDDDDEEELVVAKLAITKKAKKATKAAKVAEKKAKKEKAAKAIMSDKDPSKLKIFFSRKGDANENILTIFRDTKIIGAIIGEIVGVAVITMIALTLGLFNPLYMILAYVGITAAIVKLSGAHLNPIVTAGMMASRRVSAIRGVIYIISQILGAWVGFWIINSFHKAGVTAGNIEEATSALPTLAQADSLAGANEGTSLLGAVRMIEFIGAIIIAFFFARAQRVKKNTAAFALTVASGVFIAMIIAVVVNSNFFMLQSNTFILNPAVGMVYGIFPSSAEGFDALMKALLPMLVSYVILPVLGGIIGFFLSDFATILNGEDLKDNVEE